ncbi:aspartic peptidase domain-containing protein [Jackrogersella minutella]|nr:aspartic peptidase domain-containing protein [Jackrogersella minutella]
MAPCVIKSTLLKDERQWFGTLILQQLVLSQAPVPVQWSNQSIGPDGPWPVFEMTMGGVQTVALYPGGRIQPSYIISKAYCEDITGKCYASTAGLYDPAQGGSNIFNASTNDEYFTWGFDIVPQSHQWNSWFDNVTFSQEPDTSISNLWLALIDEGQVKLPGGGDYPLFAGCASLGGGEYPLPNGTSISIPTQLYTRGKTASDSFGMHLGSRTTGPEPSLYFGGYDQKRVLGPILTTPNATLSLKDISINVVAGYSPFRFTSTKTGLLAAGSAIGDTLEVGIDGCAPYISLPQSTCDAIAEWLPVKYNNLMGLYTWETDSPQYLNIVKSASVLSFTFLSSNDHEVTVSVPFMHLNLTLDIPLVSSPTPYFPCNPHNGGYVLGRAFLQDAFLGQNWNDSYLGSQGVLYMAQASGPNISTGPDVRNLEGYGLGVSSSSSNWSSTWDGYWTPLPIEQAYNYTAPSAGTSADTSAGTPGSGKIIGGSIGGVAAGLIVIVTGIILLRKRRKDAAELPTAGEAGIIDGDKTTPKPAPSTPQHDITNDHPIFELEYPESELP